MSKSSFIAQIQENQGPQDQGGSVFQQLEQAGQAEEEAKQAEVEQEEEQEESTEQNQEQQEFNSDDLLDKFNKGEELSEEEEQYLIDNDLAEVEGQEEFTPPSDIESLQKRFPEKKFESQADVEEARSEIYNKASELETQLQEANQKIEDITKVTQDLPEAKELLDALSKGRSLRAAIIEAGFSPEDFSVEEGDEDIEDMIEAKVNAREKKRAAEKAEQERLQNMAETEKRIESFDFPTEQRDKFYSKINDVLQSFLRGEISEETLTVFKNGFGFDDAVKKAEERGEKRGKNQKILLKKKRTKGDGTARLTVKPRTAKKVSGDALFDGLSDSIDTRNQGFFARLKN